MRGAVVEGRTSRLGAEVLALRGAESQDELAERSGVGKSQISAIERGTTCSTPDTLLKLARALGVTGTHLFELAGFGYVPKDELPGQAGATVSPLLQWRRALRALPLREEARRSLEYFTERELEREDEAAEGG
jgi:transcriptional regulator with XRE-family HTH domain